MSIAVLTPIYNPSSDQLERFKISCQELKKLNTIFYIAINSKTPNIEQIIDVLENIKEKNIFIVEDTGPENALFQIYNHVKESHVIMLNCGEIITINGINDISNNIEKYDIIYGDTIYIDKKRELKFNKRNFNRYYKYRIPILNLSSCIISNKILKKIDPFNLKAKYASDYELILRLYSENPKMFYSDSILLRYYIDGRSEANKYCAIIEMYKISKVHFPKLSFQRNIFYLFYTLKHKISPFKFFKDIYIKDYKK